MVSGIPGAKALVTGVAGFIGSFAAERLLDEGFYVVGIDNLFRGRMENLEKAMQNPRFSFHRIDIRKGVPYELVKDVDIVLHYAAINGTQHFYERPLEVLQTNVEGTIRVLEAAVEAGAGLFVYASSSEVYGTPMYYPTDERHPILLPEVVNPRHSYAASKAIGEYYTVWYSRKRGMHYLVLRIFNTYGPRMDTSKYGQVIPEFIRKIFFEKEFTIIGPGTQTRSFCYIDDHIEMTMRLIAAVRDEIVNVGNDEEVTILELARLLHEIVGKKFEYKLLPPRPGDPMRRLPSIEKAVGLTGYRPRVSLREGLYRTVKWYADKWGVQLPTARS